MWELLVGLPQVNVIGVGDWPELVRIAITTRAMKRTASRLERRPRGSSYQS